MWNDMNVIWRAAFSLAWESFKNNSIPIGAVIVDENGLIVSSGRNMLYDMMSESPLYGTNMAHAEMAAMVNLKYSDHPNIRKYTLYTTTEPCPMCFGTIVMMNIRSIHYAARDGIAGAVALNESLEYIVNKGISITRDGDDIEYFAMCLQTAYECDRKHYKLDEILGVWQKYCFLGVEAGKKLYKTGYFQKAVQENKPVEIVFDEVMEQCYAMMMTSHHF